MSDHLIETRSAARIKHLREGQTTSQAGDNQMRVYKSSPEGITLQIWRGRTMVSIELTLGETVSVSKALVAEAERVVRAC
jgi:hypothetical protein